MHTGAIRIAHLLHIFRLIYIVLKFCWMTSSLSFAWRFFSQHLTLVSQMLQAYFGSEDKILPSALSGCWFYSNIQVSGYDFCNSLKVNLFRETTLWTCWLNTPLWYSTSILSEKLIWKPELSFLSFQLIYLAFWGSYPLTVSLHISTNVRQVLYIHTQLGGTGGNHQEDLVLALQTCIHVCYFPIPSSNYNILHG